MTAEEIFNMFFGGGFPSQTVYVRRGAGDQTGRFRTSAHSHRTYHSRETAEGREVKLVISFVSRFMRCFWVLICIEMTLSLIFSLDI